MEVMKRLVFLLALPAFGADLTAGRPVYLMPMSRGLDQYLANRLTGDRVLTVVTDPKLASMVFTDRIGEAFQMQLEILMPPEKPEAPPEKDENSKDQEPPRLALPSDSVNKLENPGLNSTFGRGKGTLFLVDLSSRQVIWSTFVAPIPAATGKDMDHTASEIVSRLKKDMGLTAKK